MMVKVMQVFLCCTILVSTVLSQETTQTGTGDTDANDPDTSGAGNGDPGDNLPVNTGVDEIEVQSCNLTIGYYMDTDDDVKRLPSFPDRLGIPNQPCAFDSNGENCTSDNRTCDIGNVCTPYNETNSSLTELENNQTGRCGPCQMGQTCPAGTVTKAYSIFENRCPPGKLCESPKADVDDCPPGTFCPRGTFYEGMDGETECKSPGMFCPNGTKKDEWWCNNRTYCPNVYDSVACPKGHFCWEGSREPWKCGYPTDITYGLSQSLCPENTMDKPYSVEGISIISIVFVVMVVLGLMVKACSKMYQVVQHNMKGGKSKFAIALAKKMGGGKSSSSNSSKKGRSFPIRPGIKFTYKDLNLTVNAAGKPKVVVDRVSGEVPAATMTAVMGPSGAGKTSFMNVLCDRAGYGTTSGTITLNGTKDRISNHRDIMGFVPQDDIVHDDLTVRENLMYAAMIRLPIDKAAAGCRTSSICQQTKRRYYKDYVDEVLDMLQIGHVQHSIVGSVEKRGISGGQRKRVNIGLELVADPDVLFLDEPTSGLDSTSAEIILAALKDLSRLGRTIIMVIHQPRYSIFASMDNVIFLGPGGKTVYSGSPLDATDYFEMLGFFAPPAVNRADFFMDVIGGTISRANDPDFKPSDLFTLWKDWVEYSMSPSFQLADDDTDKSANGSTEYTTVSDDECVFRPKELNILKDLFVDALVECRAKSSTALTSEKELMTFLLLVSEAAVTEKISTRQALALGLVVRAAFYGNTSTLRIASSQASMDLHTRSVKMGKDRHNLDGVRGIEMMVSDTHSTESLTEQNALQQSYDNSLPHDVERGEDEGLDGLGSFAINGVLEWSDLAFTLNRADVMANLLKIRSLEVIGTDTDLYDKQKRASVANLANSSGEGSKLVPRVFGWDHKFAQLCMFSVRYIQKRDRGKVDWYMDCALLIAGAAVMGVIVGPTTKDSMVDTGPLLLNHLMIVLVFGTLSTISSLATFSQSRLMFWRESSQDVSIFSIWLSRNVTDLAFVLLQTLAFVGIVYDMTKPLMPIKIYYYIYVAVGFSNSGMGYFLSTFIPRRNLTLYSALISILVGAFFSGTLPYLFELHEAIIKGTDNIAAVKLAITEISYTRWAVESLVVTEIMLAPPGIISTYGAGTFEQSGFACLPKLYTNETDDSYPNPFARTTKDFLYPDMDARQIGQPLLRNLWPLFWIGMVTRIAALLGLYTFDRKQQNKTGFCDLVFYYATCKKCRSANGKKKSDKNQPAVALGQKDKKKLSNMSEFHSRNSEMEISANPAFGVEQPAEMGATTKENSARSKLRRMYSSAIDATRTTPANDENSIDNWADRVEGHGLSSRTRLKQFEGKMTMLFGIWDKIGDGILDEPDMNDITKSLQGKVHAQFGDKESRQRLKNVGYVTPQTFNQFFDWFVIQPTVDKIFNTVKKLNPKMSSRHIQKRKSKAIASQFQRRKSKVNRQTLRPNAALRQRKSVGKVDGLGAAVGASSTSAETKTSGGAGGRKKLKTQKTVYEPVYDNDTPLPANWTEFFDSNSGHPYYYNHETQVTAWERPTK